MPGSSLAWHQTVLVFCRILGKPTISQRKGVSSAGFGERQPTPTLLPDSTLATARIISSKPLTQATENKHQKKHLEKSCNVATLSTSRDHSPLFVCKSLVIVKNTCLFLSPTVLPDLTHLHCIHVFLLVEEIGLAPSIVSAWPA